MLARRRWGRPLALLVGLALAIAATAALVLTEDRQLLRLAVIAALWAFLLAAFVAGQRRSADIAAPAVPGTDLEPSRRREIELLTEVRLRREIEGGLRADLRALREDLARMREDAARLRHDILERWDGELRVERIAVHAESTRFSGLGTAVAALQDQARRLEDDGRSRREVSGPESTIEFSTRPPTAVDSPTAWGRESMEATGPVYGGASVRRARLEDSDTTVLPRIRPDPPPSAPGPQAEQPPAELPEPATTADERRRQRSRHEVDAHGGVEAAALLRRLQPAAAGAVPRRRRARADDESNDVLARLIGERAD